MIEAHIPVGDLVLTPVAPHDQAAGCSYGEGRMPINKFSA